VTSRRVGPREHAPGAIALAAGVYAQLNVFGSPTGVRISVAQGESFPPAPIGFTWRMVEAEPSRHTSE